MLKDILLCIVGLNIPCSSAPDHFQMWVCHNFHDPITFPTLTSAGSEKSNLHSQRFAFGRFIWWLIIAALDLQCVGKSRIQSRWDHLREQLCVRRQQARWSRSALLFQMISSNIRMVLLFSQRSLEIISKKVKKTASPVVKIIIDHSERSHQNEHGMNTRDMPRCWGIIKDCLLSIFDYNWVVGHHTQKI